MIPSRKQFVRSVLQRFRSDVVFLQEVKSAGFKLRNRMNYSWNGPFWASDHCKGSGGVVIALSSFLQSFVIASGSDPDDRCVWVTLLIQDWVLGFCAVYAPNLSSERGCLWDWITTSLPAV